METKTKITPTVHLNGTSKDALIDQATAVVQAIDALQDALRDAAPNGRDYYTQPQDGLQNLPFIVARDEVNRDFKALIELSNRWFEVVDHIDDQG